MNGSNLPPGVTADMIPGNRPEDEAWDKIHEDIETDANERGWSDQDVETIWALGKKVWKDIHERGGRFPHE